MSAAVAAARRSLTAERLSGVPESARGPEALLAPPASASEPDSRFPAWNLTPRQSAFAVELASRAEELRTQTPGLPLAESVVLAALQLGCLPECSLVLSPRELSIVELVADGMMNRRIARALGVSKVSVARALAWILYRSGLRDRTAIVSAALESGQLPRRPWTGAPVVVTEVQRELLALVARGLTNGEIAARLGVSYSVVANRLRLLFVLLGARDRAHLVRLAYDARVLEIALIGFETSGSSNV